MHLSGMHACLSSQVSIEFMTKSEQEISTKPWRTSALKRSVMKTIKPVCPWKCPSCLCRAYEVLKGWGRVSAAEGGGPSCVHSGTGWPAPALVLIPSLWCSSYLLRGRPFSPCQLPSLRAYTLLPPLPPMARFSRSLMTC